MELVLIQDTDELSTHYKNIKLFLNNTQPKYASHVIDALMEWFSSFRSDDNSSFALKRGINFLGRKSTLYSLFFVLIYNGNKLIAYAPLFRFKVIFEDDSTSYDVVSFCPDSTIFFYNDILIEKDFENVALNLFFDFIKNFHKTSPYIILLNHIPSSSENFPLLLKHSSDLVPAGFNVSISPVLWRGGLYPWNLNKFQKILNDAMTNEDFPEDVHERIKTAIHKLCGINRVMLAYKKNHLAIKSAIYNIFSEDNPSDLLLVLYKEIDSVFQSNPVKYPYLKLPESVDEFDASLSKSKRYFYKRYLKNFYSSNGKIIKLHGEEIVDQDIHDFISLHKERWGHNSNILNHLTAPFIYSFYRQLANNGLLTIFFAMHGSDRIACLCCIDFNGRREFISSGRSLSDEKLRAGKLLLYISITDAIHDGLYFFDFGYGDDAYKSDFNWSFLTNNVIALFYNLHPTQFPNVFPLYEEINL